MRVLIFSAGTSRLLVVLAILFTNNAMATLISVDNYTQSSATGLDWLDLTETIGLTFDQARSANNEWRQATRGDLNALFQLEFGTDANVISHGTGMIPISIDLDEASLFQSMFGITAADRPDGSLGFFYNDLNILPSSEPFNYVCVSVGGCGPHAFAFTWFAPSTDNAGQFLIRDTSVVPIPAAIWLFATGLIGFFGYSRSTR